ncbi:MAG: S49 family peptidase [Alphaproteobacteria bacterium]|nr:MAG: S49 family peptidase [Alphaproteobacteria bacterium]
MASVPKFPLLGPTVSVIRLSGVIAAGAGGSVNDQVMAPVMERAFRRRRLAAVALVVNSPGGSPVQSALVAARVRRLAEERDVPVHAFVEDVAASGGYWIAAAADQIWVDPASIVGSIGVIYSAFGLHEFIERHGIERRLYTAGERKSFMDPFLPVKPDDETRLSGLQRDLHALFIEHVRTRRGARLADDETLFSGDVWLGQKAVSLGLADGIGHLVPKMKSLYGDRVRFREFAPRRPFLRRLGSRVAAGAWSELEERAHRARWGH